MNQAYCRNMRADTVWQNQKKSTYKFEIYVIRQSIPNIDNSIMIMYVFHADILLKCLPAFHSDFDLNVFRLIDLAEMANFF